jgi:flagellin
MMNASMTDISIQVGTDGNAAKSQIVLADSLFSKADVKSLFGNSDDLTTVAHKCAGLSGNDASAMLSKIDTVINTISSRVTTLGAAQNRIESSIESIGVQSENITSSLSTLRDADVATESSNYIKAQILQQASATLLATANQTPSIALNLL